MNPAGQVGGEPAPKGQEFTYSVRAQGRLISPEEFGKIVVRETPDGGIVRVKDVARVELGAQDYSVDRALERQAKRGDRGLPVARLQRRGGRARREETNGRGQEALSAGHGLRGRPRHHRAVTEGMKEIVETLVIAIVW